MDEGARGGEGAAGAGPGGAARRRSRLEGAASPYLAAHAHDPVDWWPWGPAAFAEARARGVPVFASVGYAACHWCHVMHRESFQDPAMAAILNARFVCVKVDREEHPAVDRALIQALLDHDGEAGWPISLFLDADGQPFDGGTYFPPYPQSGMPSLRMIAEAAADRHARGLHRPWRPTAPGQSPRRRPPDGEADPVADLLRTADPDGGWGGGARFPHGPRLLLLLDAIAAGDRRGEGHLLRTLDRIEARGLHDQLGGGFHRYTVDSDWWEPHYEKMLVDNALLAVCLLRVHAAWSPALPAAAGALEWMSGTLGRPDGALGGSQDADDPAGEGAAVTWTEAELRAALAPRWGAGAAALAAGLSGGPGRAPLRRPADRGLWSALRRPLARVRAERPAAPVHDQAIVSWNALAADAFAWAAPLDPRYGRRALAIGAALRAAITPAGIPRRLGPGAPPGALEDEAAAASCFLRLHALDGDPAWVEAALGLAARAIARPWPTGDAPLEDGGPLGPVPAERRCGAEPSGLGQLALALAALEALGWAPAGPALDRALALAPPDGEGPTLARAALLRRHHRALVVTGPVDDPLSMELFAAGMRAVDPFLVRLRVDPSRPGALVGLGALEGRARPGRPVAWRCAGRTCLLPTSDPAAVAAWVQGGAGPGPG